MQPSRNRASGQGISASTENQTEGENAPGGDIDMRNNYIPDECYAYQDEQDSRIIHVGHYDDQTGEWVPDDPDMYTFEALMQRVAETMRAGMGGSLGAGGSSGSGDQSQNGHGTNEDLFGQETNHGNSGASLGGGGGGDEDGSDLLLDPDPKRQKMDVAEQ